jgi:hypothetical protein
MIATAVAFYDVVTWLHILAVVLAFGPTFAYGVFIAVAQREGGVAVPAVARGILTWDRTAGTIGMVVILLTGIYLASDRWDLSEFFISWGFVAILVLFGLVHGYLLPKTRKAAEVAERDMGGGERKLSSEFDGISAGLSKVGGLAGLIVVVTIYVMTAKPFL